VQARPCHLKLHLYPAMQADYILYMTVHSYTSNDSCPVGFIQDNSQTMPGCCDSLEVQCRDQEECDPTFTYCQRTSETAASTNASSPESCRTIIDNVMFDGEELLSLSNPIPLNGRTEGWQVWCNKTHSDSSGNKYHQALLAAWKLVTKGGLSYNVFLTF
jgi:hypothetical protein